MRNSMQMLGYAVRNARIKLGWTQAETAERAGVNVKTIHNIEALIGNPSLKHLVSIIRVLQIDPNYIFYPEMEQISAVRVEIQILLSQCDAQELDLLLRISKAVLSKDNNYSVVRTK